jgi:hypothetical protein
MLNDWMPALLRMPRGTASTRHRGTRRPQRPGRGLLAVERLEERALLAANPVITLAPGTVNFTEGSSPAFISQNATITDADSTNFGTGSLTFTTTSNGSANDVVAFQNQGTGAGQIGVSGSSLTFGGTTIGTFTGGTGGTTLTLTFNSDATLPAVQAALQNVGFSVNSQNPTTNLRTLQIIATDETGGSSQPVTEMIGVTAVNNAPVLTLPSTPVNFTVNGTSALFGAGGTVSDVDNANFNGGKLTVAISGNQSTGDLLSVRNQGTGAGQIGLSGNNLTFGGMVIGQATAPTNTTPATVTFNSNATPEAVQALVQNLQFSNATNNPSALPRTVQISLTDSAGGTSVNATRTVLVTPASQPLSLSPASNLIIITDSSPHAVSPELELNGGTGNFNGGKLLVSSQGATGLRLGLNTTGTGISAAVEQGKLTIRNQGTVIGTVTGSPTQALVIFNQSANSAAVQNLLRAITVQNANPLNTGVAQIQIAASNSTGQPSNIATTTAVASRIGPLGGDHHKP